MPHYWVPKDPHTMEHCMKIKMEVSALTLHSFPGGKIIQALLGFVLKYLAGIGRLDFLGFSPIDLTLSLDFQGVGKA